MRSTLLRSRIFEIDITSAAYFFPNPSKRKERCTTAILSNSTFTWPSVDTKQPFPRKGQKISCSERVTMKGNIHKLYR